MSRHLNRKTLTLALPPPPAAAAARGGGQVWQSKGRSAAVADPRATTTTTPTGNMMSQSQFTTPDMSRLGAVQSRSNAGLMDAHSRPGGGGRGRGGVRPTAVRLKARSPDDGSPLSQKNMIRASGSQGRRAATRQGMFNEVSRSERTNRDPTDIASTASLTCALGVGVKGEAAAKLVIGRMMRNRRLNQIAKGKTTAEGEKSTHGEGKGGVGEGTGHAGRGVDRATAKRGFRREGYRGDSGGGSGRRVDGGRSYRGGTRNMEAVSETGKRPRGRGGNVAGGGGEGGGGGQAGEGEGLFKAVLSSMAKDRLRSGLEVIRQNPQDMLRRGFVEIEPTKHGRTALGCHLMKGWAEQKAGSRRRVSGFFAVGAVWCSRSLYIIHLYATTCVKNLGIHNFRLSFVFKLRVYS